MYTPCYKAIDDKKSQKAVLLYVDILQNRPWEKIEDQTIPIEWIVKEDHAQTIEQ